MFWYIYLIIGLIIGTYLFYRTTTNMIRRSKGLHMKKYRFMYSFFNDDTDKPDLEDYTFAGIFLTLFWIIHWSLYIIYKCYKLIVLPLFTRLTLSKEERVQVAIGATPNKKGE